MQIETDVPSSSILRILPHKNYQIGEENNDNMNKKFAAISNSNIRCHFKTIFHSKSYNYYLNLQPQFPILALAIRTINNKRRNLKIEHKPNRVDWCIYLPKFSSLNHQASTMLRIDQQSGPNEGSPRKPNFSQRLLTQNACCYYNGAANDLRLSKLAMFDVLNKGNGCKWGRWRTT